MTKAQANGTKASIIAYALQLEASLEEERREKSNLSEAEMREILADEIEEAGTDAVDDYRASLVRAIDRGISFADLKELITGKVEL